MGFLSSEHAVDIQKIIEDIKDISKHTPNQMLEKLKGDPNERRKTHIYKFLAVLKKFLIKGREKRPELGLF